MRYSDLNGDKVSMLGFGAMRIPEKEDKSFDEEALEKMLDYAIEHGINYFDTAYVYHGGKSEVLLAKKLKKYPRDSYRFATKFPGHQIADSYEPAPIFEEELRRCELDYFDYYLLHNINECSIDTYMDPKWGIVDYLKQQRDEGKIRHLGFSTHGSLEVMRTFLDAFADDMEFCQIQLNYVDWSLQDAKAKCELLAEYDIPIMVMEPVRGGKLASLSEEQESKLRELRPDESIASWAFRWVESIPNVKVILSGMSNMEQVEDNVKTFEPDDDSLAITAEESDVLLGFAEELSSFVPCTGCRYCVDHCPVGLDIPSMMDMYSDLMFAESLIIRMRLDAMDDSKRPNSCIGCGACVTMCPQNIEIPQIMEDFAARVEKLPSWAAVCAARNAQANS